MALRSIVANDNGYIDQSSVGLFLAHASQEAALEMSRVEGVLAVQFVVSDVHICDNLSHYLTIIRMRGLLFVCLLIRECIKPGVSMCLRVCSCTCARGFPLI